MSFNTRKEMRNSFNDSDNDIFSLNLKKERNYSQLNLNTMNNSNSQSFIKKQKLYNRHYTLFNKIDLKVSEWGGIAALIASSLHSIKSLFDIITKAKNHK